MTKPKLVTRWIVGRNGKPRQARITADEAESGVAYIPMRDDACRVWIATLYETERAAWIAAHLDACRVYSEARAKQRYAKRCEARAERLIVEAERALDRLPRDAAKGVVRG